MAVLSKYQQLLLDIWNKFKMWLFNGKTPATASTTTTDNYNNPLALSWGTVLGALLFSVLSFYLIKWLSSTLEGNTNGLNGGSYTMRHMVNACHNWAPITVTSKVWYCSICESMLINTIGVYCDCCGVCACSECVKRANQQLPCKSVTASIEDYAHHWTKGNLPLGAICAICQEECTLELGLVDHQCCWCQRTVHTECLAAVVAPCDFGPYRRMIVPPWCVQMAARRRIVGSAATLVARRPPELLLRSVKCPTPPGDVGTATARHWQPLIVVGNRRAGNTDGGAILSAFRHCLNPAQVVDLCEKRPPAALQWCVLLAPRPVRMLVAGGDGTIASVLTASHQLDLDPEPEVAIIPLGTGNDLSRTLGWGSSQNDTADFSVRDWLAALQQSRISQLDRWRVELVQDAQPRRRHFGLMRTPTTTLFMYNYLSVGVDAQVALNFHRTRDSAFYVFGSRLFNKILYLCFGTHQVVTSDCKNLQQRLELYLDGRHIELPELESIVVLNIPYWGGGVNLWSMLEEEEAGAGAAPPTDTNSTSTSSGGGDGGGNVVETPPVLDDTSTKQSYHDGILEVVGLYSSFHIAQLQIGLSSPLRLGQAKTVEIRLKQSAPIQIDGEPWEQQSCTVRISLVNKCPVLVNTNNI